MGSRCRHVAVDAPLAPGWRWRGVDAGAVPRTATCHEVGDGADGRGPGVSGREGGDGGAGEAGPSWAAVLLGWLAWEEGRKEGMGWAAVVGQEEGENEPVKPFPISNSLFYFLTQLCICLNDFKFKFECVSV